MVELSPARDRGKEGKCENPGPFCSPLHGNFAPENGNMGASKPRFLFKLSLAEHEEASS